MPQILRGFPRGLLNHHPRRTFWRVDGLESAAGGGWGAHELVISRALCFFGTFDMSRLPVAKRASALALQLPGWCPHPDFDAAIIWNAEGIASVWCWDRAALAAAWHAAGLPGKTPRVIPETCLRAPLADGLRLLKCLDGFEAQLWRAGQLRVSRWWPSLPDATALLAFQRDCGLPLESRSSDVSAESLPLESRPWAHTNRLQDRGGQIAATEMIGYAALALAIGLPSLSLAVNEFRLYRARTTAESELAAETARSKLALDARSEALAAADGARALAELQTFPGPLVHMLAIARALPEGGAQLREWEQNDGKLRLLLVSPGADLLGADHVRALEQTGLFNDIKIVTQSDPRQMVFVTSLKPNSALALSASSLQTP